MKTFILYSLLITIIKSVDSSIDYCSMYKCGKTVPTTCSNTDILLDFSLTLTTLNPNTCDYSKSVCKFDKDSDNPSSGFCVNKTVIAPVIAAYPGEYCDQNTLCILSSKCENSICTGVSIGGRCQVHSDCLKGNYCDSTSETCIAQILNGNSCTNEVQCINTHGCYNNICTPYYSIENGSKVKSIDKNQDMACKSGFAYNSDGSNYICLSKYYLNGTVPSTNFVECTPFENSCQQTAGTFQLPKVACNCTFNEEGKSYCPALYPINEQGKITINLRYNSLGSI